MTLREMFAELERRFPGVGEKVLKSSQIAVDLEYVDCEWAERDTEKAEVVIGKGSEVGVVPPVSAG